jgi:hypothetical protein
MIKGISIAVMTAFLVASIADGQMRYSRERKPSPTPTPTPQPLIPAQKGTPPFRITPSPSPLATPQQRTKPTANQPRVMATPVQGQARQSPTPLQKLPYGQIPSQVPAQRTFSPQQPAPTPIQSRIPGRQTVTVPQPGTTPIQPRIFATPAPTPAKPTPTPVPPPDVKAYVDKQVGNSKDKKFHMTVNGKDLPLTPFHFWAARSTGFNTTSTHIDMRGDDGRVYDIEFATTGAQISSIRIHRINGEAVR